MKLFKDNLFFLRNMYFCLLPPCRTASHRIPHKHRALLKSQLILALVSLTRYAPVCALRLLRDFLEAQFPPEPQQKQFITGHPERDQCQTVPILSYFMLTKFCGLITPLGDQKQNQAPRIIKQIPKDLELISYFIFFFFKYSQASEQLHMLIHR